MMRSFFPQETSMEPDEEPFRTRILTPHGVHRVFAPNIPKHTLAMSWGLPFCNRVDPREKNLRHWLSKTWTNGRPLCASILGALCASILGPLFAMLRMISRDMPHKASIRKTWLKTTKWSGPKKPWNHKAHSDHEQHLERDRKSWFLRAFEKGKRLKQIGKQNIKGMLRRSHVTVPARQYWYCTLPLFFIYPLCGLGCFLFKRNTYVKALKHILI